MYPFVVMAEAVIYYCVHSTIVVDPFQTLCNPTHSIYTLGEVKDIKTTMSEPVLYTEESVILNLSPELQLFLRTTPIKKAWT